MQADYAPAVVARARILVRQRRIADAVTFMSGIARSNPRSAALRAEYARVLVLNNRAQDAIEEARQVLRFDERSVPAKLAVAEAYRAQSRNDLALYIINDLVNGSDPDRPTTGPGPTTPDPAPAGAAAP